MHTDLYGPMPTGESILGIIDYSSRWPEIHIIKSTTSATTSPSVPVTTSNCYSAFQPLENPANVCDFIESINLTEEEVTTDSSVKLRPYEN